MYRLRCSIINFVVFLFLVPIFGFADDVEKSSPVTVSGKLSIFSRYTDNPYFGGEINYKGSKPDDLYGEIAATVAVTAKQNTDIGLLTGQLGVYMAQTIGDDFYGLIKNETNTAWDAAGYDSESENVLLNQAWLKLSEAFGSSFDITVGRQDIALEKGFIVWGNPRLETAAWINFQQSFPFAVRVDNKFGNLSTTALWAQAERYDKDAFENDVKLYGINMHYDFNEDAYIYGSVFRKDEPSLDDTSSDIDTQENNTTSYDLGADIKYGKFQFELEGAYQTGDVITASDKFDRDAYAYWGAVTYRFEANLNPYVRGSYFYYSGDDDDSSDIEAYDPMFSGMSGWNRFFIGEFVGENQLGNSNKEAFVYEVGMSPTESLNVAIMYITDNLAEKNAQGNKHWANEIDLLVDYFIAEGVYLHVGFGYAMPGKAAEDLYGDDADGTFAQCQLTYNF